MSVLLTRKEAAEYLGLKPATLADWASRGLNNLPMVKIGNTVRYRKADLDKFIEEHLVNTEGK